MKILNIHGFTLLEVIIALVLSSIVSTMLYSNFHSALTGTTTPLINLQKTFRLHTAAENMTADYSQAVKGADEIASWQPAYIYKVGDIVKPHLKFGHIFKCIKSGKSDFIEPEWRSDNSPINDGETAWQQAGSQLIEIKKKILEKEYGEYEVEESEFIIFVSDEDEIVEKKVLPEDYLSPHNLLKISIKNDIDQKLTFLFSSTY